jgi:protein SCO1/2
VYGVLAALLAATFAATAVARDVNKSQASAPGPSFRLVDQHGRPLTEADLRGKPTVLHFGFTHCPVVCPTTLYEVAEVRRRLGADADAIHFVFVTVDPARDTVDVLNRYVGSFDDRIVAATGRSDEIEALVTAFGATADKIELPDGSYEVAHTVHAYLLDRSWRHAGSLYLGHMNQPDKVMLRLKALMARP